MATFTCPLSVFAVDIHNRHLDVTSSHLFLGYKPLVIAIHVAFQSDDYLMLRSQKKIRLKFRLPVACDQMVMNNGAPASSDIAELDLAYFEEKVLGSRVVVLFIGEHGRHTFLSAMQQFVNRQREKLQKRPKGNVDLPGNLLDQVQIAYALPRKISVITVGSDSLFNMFPTDLHGAVGDSSYVSSLRIGGKATEEVEKIGKLVISDVGVSSFREVYGMGKNHMRSLRNVSEFNCFDKYSEIHQFPLPAAVTEYREMSLMDSMDIGIHRIHTYQVIKHTLIRQQSDTLAHIHRVYAQWRVNNGFDTELFFA